MDFVVVEKSKGKDVVCTSLEQALNHVTDTLVERSSVWCKVRTDFRDWAFDALDDVVDFPEDDILSFQQLSDSTLCKLCMACGVAVVDIEAVIGWSE